MVQSRGSKAESIRIVLRKHPDYNAAQVKEELAKKGIETTTANIYDTRSRMETKGDLSTHKKRKVHKKKRMVHRKDSLMTETVELTMLREQCRKLRAVVAALL